MSSLAMQLYQIKIFLTVVNLQLGLLSVILILLSKQVLDIGRANCKFKCNVI